MSVPVEVMRHSAAHVVAAAVSELYPGVRLGVGPVVEHGFYYDIDFPSPISEDDLEAIEARAREIMKRKEKFVREELPLDEATALFEKMGQTYKVELMRDLKTRGTTKMSADELQDVGGASAGGVGTDPDVDAALSPPTHVSLYRTGTFVDLCRGPHVEHSGQIGPFKLTKLAGAYWRGKETNPQLQRIYGVCFATQEELDKHLWQLEEAKKRDHKKLGRELDLFYIDEEVGKGLPMWTPKGTAMKLALEEFTRDLERKYGYEHVSTPYLGSEKLYKTSGHLAHFKANMYAPIDMDGEIFYLRPMACPHHIRLLQRQPLSYRDLPVRYAEIADYNRYEKSGELMGMIRVRKFQLTDAHIFVSPEGLKDEFKNVCSLIREGMEGLGLASIVSYRFSKRDPNNKEKYYPDDALWEKAESTMKAALDEIGFTYTEAEDEATFYGPKLDVQARNVNGKEDTLFTAQIDFLLPEKFDITYTDVDGSKKRPVMIHRSAIGALERTFAFLIEHFAGAFPVWLSPVQVKVLPVAERHNEFAAGLVSEMRAAGIRAQIDDSSNTVGYKIRAAEKEKIPYSLVVGDKEAGGGALAIRKRGEKETQEAAKEDFIARVLRETRERS